MAKGTLVLKTNGGERKMSYSLVDGTYYMATKANSNKIAQIKADKTVAIDLENRSFNAVLIAKEDQGFVEIRNTYLSAMGGFQRFLYKTMFGRKNDMFIVLK